MGGSKNKSIVSISVASIATFLGFTTVYDYRYRFKKQVYLALIFCLQLFLNHYGTCYACSFQNWSFWGILDNHSTYGTNCTFAMAIIRLRLSQMDESLEAAAWNLGADQWVALRRIIIPFCRPAIISAFCLTAAVSFMSLQSHGLSRD